MPENQRPIVVVEDNPNDTQLILTAFEAAGIDRKIITLTTGAEVREYFSRTGAYGDRIDDDPIVVLLDIDVPGPDGIELLTELRRRRELIRVPIVAFTQSSGPGVLQRVYEAGGNAYLRKPQGMRELREAIQAFIAFWIGQNVTPRREPHET